MARIRRAGASFMNFIDENSIVAVVCLAALWLAFVYSGIGVQA